MARVLILANNDGGLYHFRKELILELTKTHEVFVSLPYGEYIQKIKNLGCVYIETEINRRSTNPFVDYKLVQHYKKVIKQLEPDIVLTYTIKPNVYGGLACQSLNVPYISNITGLGTAVQNGGFLSKVALFLYKQGLKKSKCVFFQNNENQNFFVKKKIVKNNTRLIPGSGVNIDEHKFEEYPDSEEIIKFLFIGRIMKEKGIDELLQAAKILKKDYNNIQFHLIGRYEEEKYKEEIDNLTRQSIVHYHGQQYNVHTFIKEAHAIIHPSYHEGLSNVLLEAASTGRPVIASNIPGCKETFDENISGIGFEVKNVDSLVKAIKKFIELPYEEKKKMGIAGRKKIEKEFDRNIVIDAYMDEIEKIIGG